ncbi:somatostatin receptor type 5-like [Ptychodera flava]|uniref:somatostatin receptor type 5-like n=1 Tax=Ptychodera flava TaxID=63121 RepID=UPI00396A4FD5
MATFLYDMRDAVFWNNSNLSNLDSFMGDNVSHPDMGRYLDACALEREVQHIIGAVLTILGLIGNGAFLYVVLKLPNMKTVTNLYLSSLAVADLVYLSINSVTIFCHFDNRIVCFRIILNDAFRCTTDFLLSASFLASIMTIALIGIERYIAISRPLSKGSPSSGHRGQCLWLVATSSWLPAIFLSSPALVACFRPNFDLHVARLLITIITFLVMIAIVFVFYLLIAFRLLKASRSQIVTRRSARENEKQVIRVCLITAIVFVTCLLPYVLRMINEIFTIFNKPLISNYLSECFFNLSIFLLMINAIINPVVYNAASRRYRRAFKDAFLCRRNVGSRSSHSSENIIESGMTQCNSLRSRNTSIRRQNLTCHINMEKL